MILTSLYLDKYDLDRIEYLLKQKVFADRSSCIRFALKTYLDKLFDIEGILAGFEVGVRPLQESPAGSEANKEKTRSFRAKI